MKHLLTIRTKKQLYEYYTLEMNKRDFQYFINDMIEEYGPHRSCFCRGLAFREFLTFVARYGAPQGYELSPYIKEEVQKRGIN